MTPALSLRISQACIVAFITANAPLARADDHPTTTADATADATADTTAGTTATAPTETGSAAVPQDSALPAPVANSQTDGIARLHFRTGTAHFETGDYARAAEEFQQAYELSHRTDLLYNLALCHERLAQLQPAIDAMEGYLAGSTALAPEDRQRLEARIAHMRERLRDDHPTEAGVSAQPPRGSGAGTPSTAAPTAALRIAPGSSQPASGTGDRHDGAVYESPWVWVAVAVATSVAIGLAVGLSAETRRPEPLQTTNALPGVELRAWRTP